MKLILAIVNNDDAQNVNTALNKASFKATKISSTGGFLMSGNSTFLIVVEDEKVGECVGVIEKNSEKRMRSVPVDMRFQNPGNVVSNQVVVGGATVFVLNVEETYHL